MCVNLNQDKIADRAEDKGSIKPPAATINLKVGGRDTKELRVDVKIPEVYKTRAPPSEVIEIQMEGQEFGVCLSITNTPMSTQMGRLMKTYSKRVGVPVSSLRFFLKGRLIDDDETPKQLEMKKDDVINVFHEKSLPLLESQL